jgi:hypothetical protein
MQPGKRASNRLDLIREISRNELYHRSLQLAVTLGQTCLPALIFSSAAVLKARAIEQGGNACHVSASID